MKFELKPFDPQPHAWLRPVRDADLAELEKLAGADGHALLMPTHAFVKNGELIGCASLGAMPLVLPWFHTARCKPRDSVALIAQIENLMANLIPGDRPGVICVPVVQKSPFQPFIERFGYTDSGPASVAFKKVR